MKTFSILISCTSLVTRIATCVGAMESQEVEYISTPCLIIDEYYLLQGHHLKHNVARQLVFFFRGVQTRSRYLTWVFICIIPLH
jgi:hypothetical protein